MVNGVVGIDPENSRIAVVLSSVGRPEGLDIVVRCMNNQTKLPDRIVLVVTKPEDAPDFGDDLETLTVKPEILISEKGLPRQRNRGLDKVLGSSDIVVFFDDDFVASRNAICGVARAFAEFPKVNGVTGKVLADGIGGPGLSFDEAIDIVERWDFGDGKAARTDSIEVLGRPEGLYGCNMAYRSSAVGDIRFDEKLPLYAWQEDSDFAARVPGERIKASSFVGVHCGVKNGRETAGVRLGYSQIANPWYLWRKGSMSLRFAAKLCIRNLLANHWRSIRPEPWIDRYARLRGNWIALFDIVRGRADPGRILSM